MEPIGEVPRNVSRPQKKQKQSGSLVPHLGEVLRAGRGLPIDAKMHTYNPKGPTRQEIAKLFRSTQKSERKRAELEWKIFQAQEAIGKVRPLIDGSPSLEEIDGGAQVLLKALKDLPQTNSEWVKVLRQTLQQRLVSLSQQKELATLDPNHSEQYLDVKNISQETLIHRLVVLAELFEKSSPSQKIAVRQAIADLFFRSRDLSDELSKPIQALFIHSLPNDQDRKFVEIIISRTDEKELILEYLDHLDLQGSSNAFHKALTGTSSLYDDRSRLQALCVLIHRKELQTPELINFFNHSSDILLGWFQELFSPLYTQVATPAPIAISVPNLTSESPQGEKLTKLFEELKKTEKNFADEFKKLPKDVFLVGRTAKEMQPFQDLIAKANTLQELSLALQSTEYARYVNAIALYSAQYTQLVAQYNLPTDQAITPVQRLPRWVMLLGEIGKIVPKAAPLQAIAKEGATLVNEAASALERLNK